MTQNAPRGTAHAFAVGIDAFREMYAEAEREAREIGRTTIVHRHERDESKMVNEQFWCCADYALVAPVSVEPAPTRAVSERVEQPRAANLNMKG